MRSIAEIDRDHEGMNKVCVRVNHGCSYPACNCDCSKREVPNVRGIPAESKLAASIRRARGGEAPPPAMRRFA